MDQSQFGPFVNIVALASALVATFSVLLLKMLGNIKRWAWLTADSPPFLVSAGARVLAVALMATTYVVIDNSNYLWFAAGSIACGVLGFIYVKRFDRLRRLHVLRIPLVGPKGSQLRDKRGNLVYSGVIIGSEENLRSEAARDLKKAREHDPLSLRAFMSGYGSPTVNDPEALWDRDLLAKTAGRLTVTLIYVVLFAVMTLFLAALVIEAAN